MTKKSKVNWIYNKKIIDSIDKMPNGTFGFIYKITNTKDGRFYIGKKQIISSRKTKISKREKAVTQTRKKFKRVEKESNWLVYNGSCKELNDDIKKIGIQNFKREILMFCCSKKYLTFCELEYQIKHDVLRNDNSYNANILARYFRKDMEPCK